MRGAICFEFTARTCLDHIQGSGGIHISWNGNCETAGFAIVNLPRAVWPSNAGRQGRTQTVAIVRCLSRTGDLGKTRGTIIRGRCDRRIAASALGGANSLFLNAEHSKSEMVLRQLRMQIVAFLQWFREGTTGVGRQRETRLVNVIWPEW